MKKTTLVLLVMVMLVSVLSAAVTTAKVDDATMKGIEGFLKAHVADSVCEVYGQKAFSADGVSYYFAQITRKGTFMPIWVVVCQDDFDQNFEDEFESDPDFDDISKEFEMNPSEKTRAQLHLIAENMPFEVIPNSRESFQKNYSGWFVMEVDRTP